MFKELKERARFHGFLGIGKEADGDGWTLEDKEGYTYFETLDGIKTYLDGYEMARKSFLKLLERVDTEFDNLSMLDCPENVEPDDELWDDIIKEINK